MATLYAKATEQASEVSKCQCYQEQHEGITDFNQEQIIAEIRHSVSQWEPRVQIDNIVKLTDIDDKENNTVHLRIIYSIPTLTTEQFYYDYDANAPG